MLSVVQDMEMRLTDVAMKVPSSLGAMEKAALSSEKVS